MRCDWRVCKSLEGETTMNEAVKLLMDAAGYTEKGIQEKFVIEETETEWTVKTIGYLDGKTEGSLYRAFSERGGGYEKDAQTKCAIFHLPKNPRSNTEQANITGVQTKPEKEAISNEDYSLSKSMKSQLGQLVPCLKDAEGITFDGLHREKINPKAWTVKLDHIKTSVDRAMARMAVNFCRRHYTSQEMTGDIGLLIGAGYSVQQICEVTGISERTIYRYMPQQLKDQKISQATSEGKGLQTSTLPAGKLPLKTQETTQPQTPTFPKIQQETLKEVIECASCHMGFHISRATLIDNKNYCPKCADRIKPQPKPKREPPPFKPKEKAEFRVAQMHPQKSKFELAVIQELQAEGLPLETDQEFCVQKTIPDAILKLKNRTVAIYIDNVATHEEGDERDEFLRGKLEQFYGFEICPIRYKCDSQEEKEKAKHMIKEFLKW